MFRAALAFFSFPLVVTVVLNPLNCLQVKQKQLLAFVNVAQI